MSVFKVLLSFNVLFYKAEGKVYLLVTRDKITESKLGFDYEDYTIPGIGMGLELMAVLPGLAGWRNS